MRYFADYIKGKPYQKTVLWENSSPTSNFANQNITLSDDMTNYDQLELTWAYATSGNGMTASMIFPVADFIKTLTSAYPKYFFGTYTTVFFTRYLYYVNNTTIMISLDYRINATGNQQNTDIPLRIVGIKKGLGETNPPVAEKSTFSIGTAETVITLPHAPKSIVALYNTSSQYPKAGTCMYDVVNETFLKSSGTGVWTKFEVDGDKLTLLGDNSTSNWTYDCIVV